MNNAPLNQEKNVTSIEIVPTIIIVGLALIGIFIFAFTNYIIYYIGMSLGLKSVLYKIFVFTIVSIGFLVMPLVTFLRSSSLATAVKVAGWQIFFMLIPVLLRFLILL